MQTTRLAWMAAVALGCGGGGGGGLEGFEESPGGLDDMRDWASSASAPKVYFQALMPMLIAGLAAEGDTCPVIVEDGDVTTYTGGCTDMEGQEWLGSAVADADGVVYDGFGFEGDDEDCLDVRETLIFDGAVDTQAATGGGGSFTIDVTIEIDGAAEEDCTVLSETLAIEYEGSLAASGPEGDIQTFSGSGRIGSSERGFVNATTEDEVVDMDTCQNEALSGTTTITASGHTAVVTYDGATDCEETSTVTWTYDGEDQGELEGITCSSSGGAGGAATLLLIAGAAALGRRRPRIS